jgi:uncharacterized Zn finger protein
VSPARKKPVNSRYAAENISSPDPVDDLQSLVDQVQMLRRLHKAQPSAATSAQLSRLRGLLLEALDLDDEPASAPGNASAASEFEDDHPEPFYDDDMQEEVWEEDESGEFRARREWGRYKPAKRIPVDDGLELRSRRGAIGETWWSRRFLSAVESILAGGRLANGRMYARQGQVIDLGIGSGLAVAKVQGSRRTPYGVQITMPAASDVRWDAIIDALAGQAGYAARLLAGDLPKEIEDVFDQAGVALFPERTSRLTTTCTCPDWAETCKHAAATCYLMAEAFDEDPFLLLAFRGRDREALLADLRSRRSSGADRGSEDDGSSTTAPAPPLSASLANFWQVGPELSSVNCLPKAAEVPGAVLRQLPKGVLTLRGREIGDLLDAAYIRLAADAEARAFGVGG